MGEGEKWRSGYVEMGMKAEFEEFEMVEEFALRGTIP